MKRPYSIFIILLFGFLIYAYFYTGLFKSKVLILDKYDFDQGKWILLKGYYEDEIQYIITDPAVLNKIKDSWVFYKSDRNFATTGGYIVDLYSETGRAMTMDIINDGWLSRQTSGILYNSDFGTLAYSNLNWLNDYSNDWKVAYQRYRKFNSESDRSKMLDSLKTYKNVFVLYDNYYDGTYNIKYLYYEK